MNKSKIKVLGIILLLVSFSLSMTACNGIDDGSDLNEDYISEYEVLVYDETNDEPIEGAEISLANKNKSTNSDGVAVIENIEKGEKKLEIDAPAYEDYSEYIEVSEDTTPNSTYLEIEINLADLPQSLVNENQTSTSLSQENKVSAQDSYDKDVGYMVLKSTANLYFNLLDEYNSWIENKINKIMKSEKEVDLPLARIVGGEYQEEWSYTAEDESKIDKEMLSVITEDSNHVITEGDSDDSIYDNKYIIDIEGEEKAKLFFSEDYTQYNYLEESQLFIPQEDGDDVVVDGHFQVIHNEVEKFTVILFNVDDDNVNIGEDVDDISMEMNLFANIKENENEKSVEFIYNEKDNSDPGITADYVTKFVGVEEDNNMTAGLNSWFEEIDDDNPDYAKEFELDEETEIQDITSGTINDLKIYGYIDDIESFPNETNDSPEHDFYRESEFLEQDEYPNKNQVDEIADNMTYDINVSDFDNPFDLLEEMELN